MAAGAVRALAGTAAKKIGPRFRDMFVQALPEALAGGLLNTGSNLLMGTPLDESLAYGVSDTLASAATLGLLNKAGIQNGLVRNVANLGTGMLVNKGVFDLAYKDRYAQQGQGGQGVTNQQQQEQRANVNGMTMDDIAGKYMADTMFQQLQGALNGGTSPAEMVQMMNSLGPTYDMAAARKQMASIMNV